MATNNNIVRISIFEENELVLKICNVLNEFANPTERNGFKFSISNLRLTISVYRCRNSYVAFEVSFELNSLPDDTLFNCANSMFRKCIPFFEYDKSTGDLIISIENNYTAKTSNIIQAEELTCERSSCILPLRKPFPELIMIIDIFNSVKMKKILTVNKKVLHISAIGRTTTISAKMHIVHADSSSGVAFFCSKFNYLSAQGIATFQFNVLSLSSNSPELLEITIIPPSDKEQKSKYDATMELISSISQFNS